MTYMKRNLLGIFIFCLVGGFCFAEEISINSDINYLKADSIYELKEKRSNVLIRANVQNANVYLNNILQGQAPLSLNNLSSGVYLLSVKKAGYTTEEFYIRVREGKSYRYYVELKKNVGIIEIEDVPYGSVVYVDGVKMSDYRFEVETGWHSVKVRAFGYKDFSTDIYVKRRSFNSIPVELEKANFEITSFSASKQKFNPFYKGTIGECEFDISVTTDSQEFGFFEITTINGEVVFSRHLNHFSTWTQTVHWNGRSDDGQLLPSGIYIATVTIDGITKKISTIIDYSLVYQLVDINSLGISIGTTSTAFVLPKSSTVFNFALEPTWNNNFSFYGIPFEVGFAHSLANWAEFTLRMKCFAGIEETPIMLNLGLKLAGKTNAFCYGIGVKYGYSSEPVYEPYGFSYGSGLGFTGALGIQGLGYYFGYASEYVFGSKTGAFSEDNDTWKNGIALLVQPTQNVAIKAWSNLHSNFNHYEDSVNAAKNNSENYWTRCIDSGIGISLTIPTTYIIFDAKLMNVTYFGDSSYFMGSVGLSFLY